MRILRDHYEVLGLPNTASEAEIKNRYHDLARKFHPDRAQDKVVAQRLFKQINRSYSILLDPQKRAAFDSTLVQGQVGVSRGTQAPGANGVHRPQPKTDPVKPPKTEPIAANGAQKAEVVPGQGQLTVEQALQKANQAYMSGDRKVAQQLCQNIIRADSGNSKAHLLLGDVYSDLGQRVEALTEYRTAVNTGDHSRLLQEKIKRLETQSSSSMRPAKQAEPGQRPPPTQSPPQARPKKPEPPKKVNIFQRLIGRGK